MNTKHTDSVKATQERFRDKILDIETAVRLTYNEHDADQMIKKMLDFIATLQATQKPQTTDSVEATEIAKQINNGLAMMLKPSNEAMHACRWVKVEVEKAITNLQATHQQQVEEAVEEAKKEQRERDAYLIRTSGWHVAEKLARKIFGDTEVNWYTQKQLDGAVKEAVKGRKAWIQGNVISFEKPTYQSAFFDAEEVIVITPNHQD